MPEPQKKSHQKKTVAIHQREPNDTLSAIYQSHDPHRIERSKPAERGVRRALLLGGLLICSTALIWLGFFLIRGTNQFDDTAITLSIDSPSQIQSGDEVTFSLHYQTNHDLQLANAVLRFKPPSGFILNHTEPKANGNNEYHFNLGTLAKGSQGTIKITGALYGKKDTEQQATMYFTYRPQNFNADFEKVYSKSLLMGESPLVLTIQGPKEHPAGKIIEYRLTLQNTAKKARKNIRIAFDAPDEFTINETTPLTKTDGMFVIDELAPDANWQGVIHGVFKSSAQGLQKISTRAFVIAQEKEFSEHEASFETMLSPAALTIDLSLGDTKKKGSIAPGDTIDVHVSARASGDAPIKNVSLTLKTETPSHNAQSIILWDAMTDPYNAIITAEQLNAKTRAISLAWTKKQIIGLTEINKDNPVEFTVKLPLKTIPQFAAAQFPENPILITLHAQFENGAPITTAPIELLLRSDTALSVDSEPAGDPERTTGPDGITEVIVRAYTISFTIKNTLHEIADLELTTHFPDGIIFVEPVSSPAGEFNYIASTKIMRITLNKVPITIPHITYQIKVKTVALVGDPEPLNLTDEIILIATDSVIKEQFALKLKNVERK